MVMITSLSPAISEHEPRKGTETFLCLASPITPPHFRTRTPKGDGNVVAFGGRILGDGISEHEPRKGTETVYENQYYEDAPD